MDIYIENGRIAKKYKDWSSVEQSYNLAKMTLPNNTEAVFYSEYGKMMQSLLRDDISSRKDSVQRLVDVIFSINDIYPQHEKDENEFILNLIAYDLGILFESSIYNKNDRSVLDEKEIIDLFSKLYDVFKQTLEDIVLKYEQPFVHKILVGFSKSAFNSKLIDEEQLESIINVDYIFKSVRKKDFLEKCFKANPNKRIEYIKRKKYYQREIYKNDAMIAKFPEVARYNKLEHKINEMKLKYEELNNDKEKENLKLKIDAASKSLEESYRIENTPMEPYFRRINAANLAIEKIEKKLIVEFLNH